MVTNEVHLLFKVLQVNFACCHYLSNYDFSRLRLVHDSVTTTCTGITTMATLNTPLIIFLCSRAMKGNRAAAIPIIPFSFVLAYQYDAAYGTLLSRVRGESVMFGFVFPPINPYFQWRQRILWAMKRTCWTCPTECRPSIPLKPADWPRSEQNAESSNGSSWLRKDLFLKSFPISILVDIDQFFILEIAE